MAPRGVQRFAISPRRAYSVTCCRQPAASGVRAPGFEEISKLPTWMIVEDEPDIYELLLAMFELWGIQGVAFVDGPEAVAWVDDVDNGRVRGELPEVALLDVRLPQLSGPEVAQRLRASKLLGQMGIVLITAYRLSPDDEKTVMAEAQADLLLFKPLPSLNELREMIEAVITRRKLARIAPSVAQRVTPTPSDLARALPSVTLLAPPQETSTTPEPELERGPGASDQRAVPCREERPGEPPGAPPRGDDAEH